MLINNTVKLEIHDDELNQIFAALADPTRRAILVRLSQNDATVTEIAEPFNMSLPAISRHLKVLEHAGLVAKDRIAQQRSCKLVPGKLKEATDWLEYYRQFWEANLDHLDEYLEQLKHKE